MSGRTSVFTVFAVGCAFVLGVTLLVILQKSQRALEVSQSRLHLTEGNLIKLKQQFDTLYEYKDRLEKSFMSFKTEKAAQFMPEKFVEMELSMAKEVQARQIQQLQDELKACRQQEREKSNVGKSSIFSNIRKGIEFMQPSHQVPITSSPLPPLHRTELRSSAVAEELKQHLNANNMKEAIQSPIGHVPPVPAIPSGDPNEDLAGNVIE